MGAIGWGPGAEPLFRLIRKRRHVIEKALEKMASKLFVGNLSYSTTDDRIREVFEQYGEVLSATVVRDRATGQSRGFGFVEFGSDEHDVALDRIITED